MPNVLRISVPTRSAALVWPGRSSQAPGINTLLLVNTDSTNTIYVSDISSATANDDNTIPIPPSGSISVDPGSPWYTIGSVAGINPLVMVPNGQSYFLPASLSQIGGAKIFVQDTTPTGTIPLNSIWIDTANGSINNWNGTIWVQQEFNATNLIQAGTIVASLIEANTITAAQLAAGIVYAGIINGTTVNAATFNGSTFNGTNFSINANGAFFYSGTPAANNLILSVCTQVGFIDPFGNNILTGTVSYTPVTGGYAATQVDGIAFAVYFATTMTGSFPWNQEALLTYNDTASPTIILQSDTVPLQVGSVNSYVNLFGAGCLLFGLVPPSSAVGAYLFVDSTSQDAALQSNFGFQGIIPITQVNTGTSASGNATAFTDITHKFTLDSTLVPNSRWTLRVNFNGTWGLQVMSIGADINGTVTSLGGLAAAFAAGAASGDGITGWIEIEVYIVSTTTCRIACKGYVHDNTVAANNSDTAGSGIATTVATGVAIAGGDTLAIAIKFAASVAAQTITPEFESITRDGA